MSNIAIYLDQMPSAKGLMAIHRATGSPLAAIRERAGDSLPIWEAEVFDSGYDSKAAVLRAILAISEGVGARFRFYEIPEGSTSASCTDICLYEISSDGLRAILDTADAEYDRQLGTDS